MQRVLDLLFSGDHGSYGFQENKEKSIPRRRIHDRWGVFQSPMSKSRLFLIFSVDSLRWRDWNVDLGYTLQHSGITTLLTRLFY